MWSKLLSPIIWLPFINLIQLILCGFYYYLGHVQTYALSQGGFFNIGTLGVMYVYGFDLL